MKGINIKEGEQNKLAKDSTSSVYNTPNFIVPFQNSPKNQQQKKTDPGFLQLVLRTNHDCCGRGEAGGGRRRVAQPARRGPEAPPPQDPARRGRRERPPHQLPVPLPRGHARRRPARPSAPLLPPRRRRLLPVGTPPVALQSA
jgi:hypothetical protein